MIMLEGIMYIQFLGAAREVTGSCYFLEANNKKILIDCGMEQGKDVFQNIDFPISASLVDAVLLTHAHIDHSGNLPLLVKKGFNGPIYSTTATFELCEIMLKDSAFIQENETEWHNRKAQRAGNPLVEPVYTIDDVQRTINLFQPIEYENTIEIFSGIKISYRDVGHLLGSASIKIDIEEGEKKSSIVFSGDIGNINQPILKDPSYFTEADYVVMESTYGDRLHGERPDYIADLSDVIQSTLDRGGNVVIPSFAVGRTQELLYFIREIKEKGLVKNHQHFPVYVDSPLAIEATNIFKETSLNYFDQEMRKLVLSGINPLLFDDLKISLTSDDSKQINFDITPKVIISASGMCNAGRIRHHLKHNLWRPESTVLFVGYQSVGTLGRIILDGAKTVKLFGETIDIKAQIRTLKAISGHADKDGLMRWAKSFSPAPKKFFICHGEERTSELFADSIKSEITTNVVVPYNGEKWDISTDKLILEGNKRYIEKDREYSTSNPLLLQALALCDKLLDSLRGKAGLSNSILREVISKIEDIINYIN